MTENNQQLHHHQSKTILGFWVYLMTDLLMFAALFATYAVLRNNTFGGPAGRELFSLPLALVETLILLTSSVTCGLGLLSARSADKKKTFLFFGATFVLGLSFLLMEFSEFSHLIAD